MFTFVRNINRPLVVNFQCFFLDLTLIVHKMVQKLNNHKHFFCSSRSIHIRESKMIFAAAALHLFIFCLQNCCTNCNHYRAWGFFSPLLGTAANLTNYLFFDALSLNRLLLALILLINRANKRNTTTYK